VEEVVFVEIYRLVTDSSAGVELVCGRGEGENEQSERKTGRKGGRRTLKSVVLVRSDIDGACTELVLSARRRRVDCEQKWVSYSQDEAMERGKGKNTETYKAPDRAPCQA
jgi:hypothetical protein